MDMKIEVGQVWHWYNHKGEHRETHTVTDADEKFVTMRKKTHYPCQLNPDEEHRHSRDYVAMWLSSGRWQLPATQEELEEVWS